MSTSRRPPAARPAADPAADPAQVAAVRAFSRFYTRLLGLLDEHPLAGDFSLTEMRVLYELAQAEAAQARQASVLAQALGLDAAHLSRLLRRFEQQGLLRREPHAADGRRRQLQLTRQGRAAFARLDRASAAQVAELLAPLAPPEAAEVVAAMQRVQQLLGDAGRRPGTQQAVASPPAAPLQPVILRDLQIGDIGWIACRQGQLYAQEYGWDMRFEALVAQIAARFVERRDPLRERAWVAERGGRILGSVFCVRVSAVEAKLRLLYVEPEARGLGLGAQLTDACIAYAREQGYRRLSLWTNAVLVAARRIYESRGFQLVKEETHHSFGHELVGQYWRLSLLPAAPNRRAAPR